MEHLPQRSPLFQVGSYYGNVVLNILHDADQMLGFGFYARKFHEAGQALFERMFARASYSSLEACPIVFLYRHALELYLKGIVLIGCEISQLHGETLANRERLLKTHQLLPLLPPMKQTFGMVGWIWQIDIEGLRTFDEVEEVLRAFEEIDPGSYTFRYPVNTNGQPSVPHHFIFHMPTFCERMDTFLNMLEAAVMGLEVTRDQMMEAAYHAKSDPSMITEQFSGEME